MDNNTLVNNKVGNTSDSNLVNTTDGNDQTIIVNHWSHISDGVKDTYNETQPDNSKGNVSNYQTRMVIYLLFLI